MWELANESGLDANSPYAYVLWGHHHHRTTVVAERAGALVGFVLGYVVPTTSRDLFVWQIGVAEPARSKGLAGLMLDTLCRFVRPSAVLATVTPSNTASAALFSSFARRHQAELSVVERLESDLFPNDHEPEDMYRIVMRSRAITAGQPSEEKSHDGAV